MKEILYLKFLDDEKLERLRLRIKTNKGRVIDVVVQYESYINTRWIPIVSYDCAHGFFHRDLLYPGAEKEKQTINISPLEDALNYTEQDI